MCLGPEVAAAMEAAAPYITAASAALTAGSSYAQAQAQRKAGQERDAVALMESERQRRLGQEQAAELARVTASQEQAPQEQSLEKAVEARTAAITPQAPAKYDYVQGAATAPSEVKGDIARKMVQALQAGQQEAKRGAKVGAYGDVLYGNRLNLSRAGERIGQLQNFQQGGLGTLQMGLNAANQAGGGYRSMADVMAGLGQIGMLYGMTRPGTKVTPGAGSAHGGYPEF